MFNSDLLFKFWKLLKHTVKGDERKAALYHIAGFQVPWDLRSWSETLSRLVFEATHHLLSHNYLKKKKKKRASPIGLDGGIGSMCGDCLLWRTRRKHFAAWTPGNCWCSQARESLSKALVPPLRKGVSLFSNKKAPSHNLLISNDKTVKKTWARILQDLFIFLIKTVSFQYHFKQS